MTKKHTKKNHKNKIKSYKINNTQKNTWKKLMNKNCRYINNKQNLKRNKLLKKIALEEAFTWPTQKEDVNEKYPLEFVINSGNGNNKYNRLLDITDGLREKEMDKNNVIIQVLSPTAPGLENLKIKTIEGQVKKAIEVNNYLYNKIKNKPTKFKGFASLPMRDPLKASLELDRCIKELGMVGALVNGPDIIYKNNKKEMLFYDTPEYDILWKKFEELDVPLYIHPAVYESLDTHEDKTLIHFYKEYPELVGSAWGFTIYLAQQIMRIMISGVFDRFPKLKIIIGHMGELLPWMAERFDHRLCVYKKELTQLSKQEFKKNGLSEFKIPKLTLSEYLKRNIYITTSGWFSDDALLHVINKVGIDRVMFSIDYPYEEQSVASEWLENIPLSFGDKEKIAYKNAAKLLKLNI